MLDEVSVERVEPSDIVRGRRGGSCGEHGTQCHCTGKLCQVMGALAKIGELEVIALLIIATREKIASYRSVEYVIVNFKIKALAGRNRGGFGRY